MTSPSRMICKNLYPVFRSAMLLSLTPQEQKLQNILLDVAKYIDASKEPKSGLELRFAGGWVRDKLLGIPSHDIDTAISALTGKEYGRHVQDFLSVPAHREKHGLSPDDIGNFHVIEANQEKSKHLQTVTVSLLGLELDFVNLRTETYSTDSRNPQMAFGTPEEDARRRDATINALFYNLHTAQIEDYVGGLADLDAKIVRTPMKPYQTFMDDPLRVLRLIRFASRLGFRIDAEVEACMSHPDVVRALKSGAKISRERVGVEVEKMLKGQHPRESLRLFDRLGLYSTIFTYEDPKGGEVVQPDTAKWNIAYDCLETIRCDDSADSLNKVLIQAENNKEAGYHAWLLAALTPWAAIPLPSPNPRGKTDDPPATHVVRHGMRLGSAISNLVTGALRSRGEICEWKRAVCEAQPRMHERDTLGMAIRRWANGGGRDGNWRLPVLFALLADATEDAAASTRKPPDFTGFFAGWRRFLAHLGATNLMDAPACAPLVSGALLLAALDADHGKWTGDALDMCLRWQFRNPGVADPGPAIAEVRARRAELGIPEGRRADAGTKAGKRRKTQREEGLK